MDDPCKFNRTWLCSVVFIDIVNYSSQSVRQQMEWKQRLNDYLAHAIQSVPEVERVILDTGDGAALCFLGDPEVAMFCALTLRASLAQDEPQQKHPMHARIGINLGPVKLVRDINTNLNAIGDGINIGQRVMSFAGPNQILVSRSYFEVISCLSEDYSVLFKYEGIKKDKHVREHAVYELTPPGEKHEGPRAKSGIVVAPQVAGDQPASLSSNGFDPATLEGIQAILAAILGPIARHLIRAANKNSATLLDLCMNLASHIPAKKDQEVFLKRCRDELGLPIPVGASEECGCAPEESAGKAGELSAAVVEKAKRELAAYIGPVAKLVVDRAASKALSAQDLYEALAGEIGSPEEREQFLARVT